jgi:uncharacterized protein
MTSEHVKASLEKSLPPSVLAFLLDTAREFRPKGAELILFGSFAQGQQRPNSDIDLAIRWTSGPIPGVRQELADRIDALPSIRPVDLVDLAAAGDRFKSEILEHAVNLADL